ncbi:putative siderophore transport system permease protein YfhA [Paenibacillus sp. CCS19]|uniref:FecCD family ABC transporter permease n=1 Tax=Paenibacillus sp. CCS19 TaxID=3158387 RepID=UPI00256539E2|nr:iron ABC transporter permease [Paenibacillus cellulosilyticus]GMK37475.1 putative siderophore transport system permease protein YfhA [Paenibacillus cellulosilyticus]
MKSGVTIRFDKPAVSLLIHKKTLLLVLFLTVLSVAAMLISTGLGDMRIRSLDVIRAIFGHGSQEHELIVRSLRLPRIITGFLVGMSLAAAGSILQGMIRNPLASPDIIGITSGASVAAVAFISYLSSSVSIIWLPVAAMAGAGAASIAIYLFAWKQGVTSIRLVLVGIGLNFLLAAATKVMLLKNPDYSTSQAYVWLVGTVYGSDWGLVTMIAPWIACFLPLAWLLARNVNVLQLGDDVAASVGSAVQRQRFMLLMISVALAGASVAAGGAISFIGLIAPHMARKLVGPSFGSVLPVSALIGGITVVVADTIARSAFPPYDIPVGVFTAGVGAPFFIYLLYRNRNA